MTRALALFALAPAALALGGCDSFPLGCDRNPKDNPKIRYVGGTTEGGVYMTSPYDGPLLDFPGGIRYELVHQLGAKPAWIDAYLSFDRWGVRGEGGNPTGGGASVAPAAGNQVEIEAVDEHSIVVTNGACPEYWLLVVAGTGPRK
ncbi:MAG TPA: hypothetical protein VHB21_13625 [Minicystis sp.]|nr:hypothetical protein [Minicystis sp.]